MQNFKTKRPVPFAALPRNKRSEDVIRIKNEIRRDADKYGGRFTSHGVLSEPGHPDFPCQIFDFYFLGTDRFTIWNACAVTARQAFLDEVHVTVRERMRFDLFGDQSFQEYLRTVSAEMVKLVLNEPPVIYESFNLVPGYIEGVGLNIVLDVDAIDKDCVEAAIDRFFELGETDWTSPEPVPRNRLPVANDLEIVEYFNR